MRLDAFCERCRDALDFTRTIVQFLEPERIGIGGMKGRVLTSAVVQIYEEFKPTMERFQSVTYDIMDVGAVKFDEDFYQFRCAIKDLDRRLSSVLATGFEDLDTL